MNYNDFFKSLELLFDEFPFMKDVKEENSKDSKNIEIEEPENDCCCEDCCDCNCNEEYYDNLDDENEEDKDLFSYITKELDKITILVNEIKTKNEEKKQETPKIERPSDQLTTEEKLNLHKLVGEYVDTKIKPYANETINNNVINNIYAGLFEFGAWLANK